MSENKSSFKKEIALFGNVRVMTAAALLAAMSFILGKFLQIPNPFQNVIRISFENLPIIMAGICFGPMVGGVCGAVADIIGCLLYGYSINPIVTLGAVTVGAVSGVMANYIFKKNLWSRCLAAVITAHITGSVIVKSFGLAAWYLSNYDMGLRELMLWRLLTYAIIGTAEYFTLYFLLSRKVLANMISGMKESRRK